MTNTNCLEGIRCPACGNEDRFRIAATSVFTVTDDGTDDHADVEWDDSSHAQCAECDRSGALGHFRAEPSPEPITSAERASPLLVPSGAPLAEGKLYLRLYHGRNDPAQEMEDWGFDGPTFGPLYSVVQTYISTIRLHGNGVDEELWLDTRDDVIAWDGAYYGDLCVFVAGRHDHG